MNLKKMTSLRFWMYDRTGVNELLDYDRKLYMHWSGKAEIPPCVLHSIEWRYLKCLRQAQANKETVWGHYYRHKLSKMTDKTGIWIPAEIDCGKGLIIAHWGRIIMNPRTVIGDDFSISSGVVIGRDIRGKRKGTPMFGNKVVLKTNAVVVGNVHIGNDVLIAPNAYVNFDVPDHSIVIGNPGKIISRENATEGYI